MFDAMGRHILFKCPVAGMNVQHWLADEPTSSDSSDRYETVLCQACMKLHFINKSSGKLAGQLER